MLKVTQLQGVWALFEHQRLQHLWSCPDSHLPLGPNTQISQDTRLQELAHLSQVLCCFVLFCF